MRSPGRTTCARCPTSLCSKSTPEHAKFITFLLLVTFYSFFLPFFYLFLKTSPSWWLCSTSCLQLQFISREETSWQSFKQILYECPLLIRARPGEGINSWQDGCLIYLQRNKYRRLRRFWDACFGDISNNLACSVNYC